jgi:hypothetical protein
MNWINMLFYQLTWIAAVAGAGRGLWWPGPLLLLIFAMWQLRVSSWRRADEVLMLLLATTGLVVDSTFIQCSMVSFSAPWPWAGLAPAWMLALWVSLALTLNHSLAFLQSRLWLAALLGGGGAPLAYWAASHAWHALTFVVDAPLALLVIAILWAVLTPLLVRLAGQLRNSHSVPAMAAVQRNS